MYFSFPKFFSFVMFFSLSSLPLSLSYALSFSHHHFHLSSVPHLLLHHRIHHNLHHHLQIDLRIRTSSPLPVMPPSSESRYSSSQVPRVNLLINFVEIITLIAAAATDPVLPLISLYGFSNSQVILWYNRNWELEEVCETRILDRGSLKRRV
ncbi:uncharacterized protein LOC123905907 [Trifolium pratense]|uniref:uncharacterized protein LOC123905907 n=1 Tax=Trifolium pratense TaxID=57577 RepID=UPI001E692D69|nr:uncharacterized protein LOC123905907 [Trifolium pratense]